MSTLGFDPKKQPLAVRMRPRTLDEVAGQTHLLYPGSPLRQLAADHSRVVSVILWGPPGTGKTTIAQALAQASGRRFVELSAVTAGVKDVRAVLEKALNDRDLFGTQTVLFLDEIHRFTKSQQDALLPGVENGWVTLVAATTENPSFSVISPLLSRSLQLTLKPLSAADLTSLLNRAVAAPQGLNNQVRVSKQALETLTQLAMGDARRALTFLEAAANAAQAANDTAEIPEIDAQLVTKTVNQAAVAYDKNGDQHYDVTSAFIKSIRGSHPDAAIHYLARMLAAGEDPRFIARRLLVHAAEDIGIADPQALLIAQAAAQAVQLVGMPEARIPLAEATIYLACAPKSNAVYAAINAALADVRAGKVSPVPAHLRDSHYAGAAKLGHGQGYVYPHADMRGVVAQQYLPEALTGTVYYVPSQHGQEAQVAKRLAAIRDITG